MKRHPDVVSVGRPPGQRQVGGGRRRHAERWAETPASASTATHMHVPITVGKRTVGNRRALFSPHCSVRLAEFLRRTEPTCCSSSWAPAAFSGPTCSWAPRFAASTRRKLQGRPRPRPRHAQHDCRGRAGPGHRTAHRPGQRQVRPDCGPLRRGAQGPGDRRPALGAGPARRPDPGTSLAGCGARQGPAGWNRSSACKPRPWAADLVGQRDAHPGRRRRLHGHAGHLRRLDADREQEQRSCACW